MRNYKDINSKTIFENAELCAQFIRDNIDIPILKNVQPEDIEDVSARYLTYFGVEYDADTVKCIRLRDEYGEHMFYMISLIEHKSQVDYNVSIQLLKYMACIWAEYEKEHKEQSRNKNFRYPPILPIVYYEGAGEWTADMSLKNRIFMNEIFEDYIPDMTYIVVSNHDYSNEELLSRENAMALLMLINKIQNAQDLSDFLQLPQGKLDEILQESPERIVDIIVAMVQSLCHRMNASQEEIDECVEKVRQRQMGYLFENMEKMDIQAERRNTAKARAELASATEKLTSTTEKLAKKDEQLSILLKYAVESSRQLGNTKEQVINKLVEQMNIELETAKKAVENFWNV